MTAGGLGFPGLFFGLVWIVFAAVAGLLLGKILNETIHPNSHDLSNIISLYVCSGLVILVIIFCLFVALLACAGGFVTLLSHNNSTTATAEDYAAQTQTRTEPPIPKLGKNKIVPTSVLPPESNHQQTTITVEIVA